MKHLCLFESFGAEFDSEKFMNALKKEMSWNNPEIRQLNPDEKKDEKNKSTMTDSEMLDWVNIKPGTWSLAFYYTCNAGQSVIKDLKNAIKKFDPSLKPKIKRDGDTSARSSSHDYIIVLK